jgi:excisionase family DNA binding protein
VNPLLSVDDAAKLFNCTPAAIRKWIYRRQLAAVKIGRLIRLRLEDIEAVATKGLPEPGQAVQPVRRAPRCPQEPNSGRPRRETTPPVAEARLEPTPLTT